jgi:hypothetical protein
MRDKMARITGQIAAIKAGAGMMPTLGAAATPAATAPQLPNSQPTVTPSEAELGARYAEIPPKAGDLQIEGRSDGFVVNGRPFIDPEGPITDYAFDVVSGNIGYLVEGPAGHVLKVTRAGASTEPLKIASARETAAGWQVVTTTGKTIAGERYSVTPDVGLRKHLNAFIRIKDEFVATPYPAWTAIGVTELITDGTLLEIRVIAKRA